MSFKQNTTGLLANTYADAEQSSFRARCPAEALLCNRAAEAAP